MVLEDQNVVIIDDDAERLDRVNESLDVQTIEGMGCHPDILELAGCGNADMVIAVTKSDEINMVACQMAYSLYNVPKKIARVRHSSYLNLVRGHLFTPDNMPVDVIISPEIEVAESVLRILNIPGAFDATEFAHGQITMVGVRVGKDSPVNDVPLQYLSEGAAFGFVVTAIYRNERAIVPRGSDHLEEGDEVYFVCHTDDLLDVMTMMGYEQPLKTKRAMVLGGGHIGVEVAKRLEQEKVNVRLLDRSHTRCDFLSDLLNKTTVIHGDAMDKDLLEQENIAGMDAVIAVTSDDSVNIVSSILAQQMGAESVVTRINRSDFTPIVESVKLPKIISPLEITASRILQHVRRGHIHSLYTIHGGHAQMIEAQVRKHSVITGNQIQDVKLPEGVIIAAIFTPGEGVVLPKPDTVIRENDRVILFSTVEQVADVEVLF